MGAALVLESITQNPPAVEVWRVFCGEAACSRLIRCGVTGQGEPPIMISFRSSIIIRTRPEAVFHLLANLHRHHQAEGSPVLALGMTTPGPPGLGSTYREVVRMLPFYNARGRLAAGCQILEPMGQ